MDLSTAREDWGFWVLHGGKTIAGVIRASYSPESVSFVTPDTFGLQVAVMSRPAGYQIPAHFHLPVPRDLVGTQEVLLIRRGKLRADLFDEGQEYLGSVELGQGDVIILNSGGHGFQASEDCLFIEVKQGPYVPGKDKEVFESSVGVTLEPEVIR